MTYRHSPPARQLSVNTLAREAHAVSLREGTYANAPEYNKPWGELTAMQRRLLSRGLVQAMTVANQSRVEFGFEDEYSSPRPDEPGFIDPNNSQG